MLMSKATSEALDYIVGGFFDLNRTTDRMVSIMQNTWSMPHAADIIHHKIAHLYPLLADKITEIKDRYNLTSIYPATHKGDEDYTNLEDMFTTLYEENAQLYGIIKDVNKIAINNDDFNVHADLVNIMQLFNELMGQIITLRDKSVQIPEDYVTFDRYIKSWGITGLSNKQLGI